MAQGPYRTHQNLMCLPRSLEGNPLQAGPGQVSGLLRFPLFALSFGLVLLGQRVSASNDASILHKSRSVSKRSWQRCHLRQQNVLQGCQTNFSKIAAKDLIGVMTLHNSGLWLAYLVLPELDHSCLSSCHLLWNFLVSWMSSNLSMCTLSPLTFGQKGGNSCGWCTTCQQSTSASADNDPMGHMQFRPSCWSVSLLAHAYVWLFLLYT